MLTLYVNGKTGTLSDSLEEDLVRSVMISLFTWRRADPDDDLPGTTKAGWWGDTFSEVIGDLSGSKLWLLQRAKLTTENLAKAQTYAQQALQWLIDDGVASRLTVNASRGDLDRLDLAVEIYKPNQSEPVSLRFEDVWSDIK